jgi:molecular chaperone DnaK (HSP70)
MGDGLFCQWCGHAATFTSPRLLEALAIETAGDEASAIVPYGSRLPMSWSDVFSTAEDGQATFQVRIVVGNSTRASECRPIVMLVLPLAKPGPRGKPRITLTLHVSAEGDLQVEALEHGTSEPIRRAGFKVAVARG